MPQRRPRAVLVRLALAGAVSAFVVLGMAGPVAAADPSPSPTVDPSPSPTATPEPSPSPTATPEPSPSPSPSPSPEPTPTPDPSPSPDPSPTPTPDPSPTPSPTPTPSPSPAPTFSMNLYKSAAYVRQYTSSWCTGAATQMMGNLIRLRSNSGAWIDRWWARQRDMVRYAKARDTLRVSNGTDPQGWAAALRGYGIGSTYRWQAFADFDEALREAVTRMRATGRPVGLLAWSGRHAWVLHGFTATADPATTADFQVTQVRVSGPLQGNDPINGAFTPNQLRPKWGRYAERDGYLGWVGDFVLITP